MNLEAENKDSVVNKQQVNNQLRLRTIDDHTGIISRNKMSISDDDEYDSEAEDVVEMNSVT